MERKVKVAIIQMGMSDSIETNLEKATRKIDEAAKIGAKIIALPELFTTPYFPQDEKTEKDFPEEIPGKTTELLSKSAKENQIILVAGSIYEKAGNKQYNTSVVVDESGKILGKYRKMHIPHDPNFYEQCYFEKGDLGYQIFKTKYGNIGVLICYDQWFPEAARALALMGADIIFYPTAIGTVKGVEQKEGDWQHAWETVQIGHGIANCIHIAPINRVGTEKEMDFFGGSFISGPFGKILAHAGNKEEVLIGECDFSENQFVRDGWRFFKERRPETYKKLLEK